MGGPVPRQKAAASKVHLDIVVLITMVPKAPERSSLKRGRVRHPFIDPACDNPLKHSFLTLPQPCTGEEPDDLKKPRRSERISSQIQTTPLKSKQQGYLPSPLTHKESTVTEERESTVSPVEGKPSQLNHRSPPSSPLHYTQGALSSPPPSDTQAFSQFFIPPKTLSHEVQDEEAEGVWGYLVPIDSNHGQTLVLKNRLACPAPFPAESFGKGSKERGRGGHGDSYVNEETTYEKEKRNVGFPASGYLIGRHPECGKDSP